MKEYEVKIYKAIYPYNTVKFLTDEEMNAIKTFISNCSLTEFEVLKNLDYELSQATDNEA